MNRKNICMLFALSFLWTNAQEDSIKTILIKEVEVSGYRSITSQTPVQRFKHDDLERIGVNSLTDAMKHISGVQIADYGGAGGLKTLTVRSIGAGNVGIFYDGIETENFQNGSVDLSKFSIDNIEEVSVCNGHEPFLLQPAKSYLTASNVMFFTKVPTFINGSKDNFRFTIRGGSFFTIASSASWEHQWRKNIKTSLNLEYLNSSGEYDYRYTTTQGRDTTCTRKNTDIQSLRIEGNLFATLSNWEWKMKVAYYHSQRGVPGAIFKDPSIINEIKDRKRDNDFRIQSHLGKHFSKLYWLSIGVKYALENMDYKIDQITSYGNYYSEDKYRLHDTYLSVAHLFHITTIWNVALANDFQWNIFNSTLADYPNVGRTLSYNSLSTSLSLGVLRLQGSLLQNYAYTSSNKEGQSQSQNEWSPTISFRIIPIKGVEWYIRGFYKHGFKLPTLNDLFYPNYGNIDLLPEHNDHYDLGFSYFVSPKENWLQKCEVQADIYYSDVRDKIISAQTDNPYVYRAQNISKAKIIGINFSSKLDWGTRHIGFSLRLNYSYQNAKDKTEGTAGYNGQISHIPFHNGSVLGEFNYENWNFGWHFLIMGKRYTSSENTLENELPSWNTHDISISGKFSIGKTKMKVGAGINNLFNTSYEMFALYPMPMRNFALNISLLM
ncbi:MAG TPA: hypothetical protein DDY68_02180 [Porphyromonadaceae bacterium]|nr:hypothetical protein [Porphyromonadaceae bacterium]